MLFQVSFVISSFNKRLHHSSCPQLTLGRTRRGGGGGGVVFFPVALSSTTAVLSSYGHIPCTHIDTRLVRLVANSGRGGGGSNFPYILLNEIQTMFTQLAKQSSIQEPAVL